MPNFGYHLARAQGNAVRRIYTASLASVARRVIEPPRELAFEVYSYSGEAMLPEQVASIRSFLRFAGRPQKFTVVSDGTHPRSSVALLRSLDPSVVVSEVATWLPGDLASSIPHLSCGASDGQAARSDHVASEPRPCALRRF
jgi:hypothetical protein